MEKTKSITKIAAVTMAVMLTAAAFPAQAYAVGSASTMAEEPVSVEVPVETNSTSSKVNEADMKAALTKVKQRVDIPDELSEFSYSTSESYGITNYFFTWSTPNDESWQEIRVTLSGDTIVEYDYYNDRRNSGEPSLAKLTEEEILAKAKSYFAELNPNIKSRVDFELYSLSLFGNQASVKIQRYENGVKVDGNDGTIRINKNTGALEEFHLEWWETADFSDPSGAKSEEEIREAYKSLCKLTPTYRIQTDWETKKKTARIVYEPSFTGEIDAFTGEKSTVWDDMREAGGTLYSADEVYAGAAVETAEAEMVDDADTGEGGVNFTEAELKKLQQNEKLLTAEQVFELMKKNEFVAVTDEYEIKSYGIYADGENKAMPLTSSADKKDGSDTYFINVTFSAKEKNFKGYKNVRVTLNAETGEIISLNKYSNTAKLPKLDVGEAKAAAENAAKHLSLKFMQQCYPDVNNDNEVRVWDGGYETSREFRFNRFLNGIPVSGDHINVTVDSNGVVTNYYYNYTDDVDFPGADILTNAEALEKLYTQRNFKYNYTGWIDKQGAAHSYLVYEIGDFYLNAKTGEICYWNGSPREDYSGNVEYTDIKGIQQEQAILTMQKYGVTDFFECTNGKFQPSKAITKQEFENLVSEAVNGYYNDVPEQEGFDMKAYKAEQAKPVTRTDAAVIFTNCIDRNGIASLKGIYKTPFSDVKSTDENIGAIAIAYAKGFIPKGDGKFNGGKQLTRAEAVQMIYDYLVYLSK